MKILKIKQGIVIAFRVVSVPCFTLNMFVWNTVKWLSLKDIEIRNGMSIPHSPIVTSPAFPTELPSHSILGNGSK